MIGVSMEILFLLMLVLWGKIRVRMCFLFDILFLYFMCECIMMMFLGIWFGVSMVVWLSFLVSVSVVGVWFSVGDLSMVFRWFMLKVEMVIDGGRLLVVFMVKFFG